MPVIPDKLWLSTTSYSCNSKQPLLHQYSSQFIFFHPITSSLYRLLEAYLIAAIFLADAKFSRPSILACCRNINSLFSVLKHKSIFVSFFHKKYCSLIPFRVFSVSFCTTTGLLLYIAPSSVRSFSIIHWYIGGLTLDSIPANFPFRSNDFFCFLIIYLAFLGIFRHSNEMFLFLHHKNAHKNFCHLNLTLN